jgi:catalase
MIHPRPPRSDRTADRATALVLFSYLDTQLTRLGGPNFSQPNPPPLRNGDDHE